MELYYKEERDRDLFRAYNEALKSLGKMAVNVPREQIVRRVVYSIAPRFYISYEEETNFQRLFTSMCVIDKNRDVQRFGQYVGELFEATSPSPV